MGRSYVVEEAVEKYLSQFVGDTSVTGLFIGQSSSQRDYVVMASRTPEREGEERRGQSKGCSPSKQLEVQWVAEHARQVSRMLPGGLCVLGVFLVTSTDQGKEAQNILRQMVFAVDKLIGGGQLWDLREDDITDRVTLHVCSKTRKVVCRTIDVKDPKSSAKPADWKYHSDVCSSWPTVSCSVGLQLLVPLPGDQTSVLETELCIKTELRTWALQVQSGVCFLNGTHLPDDTELQGAQKKHAMTAQMITAQLCIPLVSQTEPCNTATVQACSGSVCVKGVVHARAYVHGNKPKAKHAVKLIKRDVMKTVSDRLEMLLEEVLVPGSASGEHILPRRVFCTLQGSSPGVCVCDYMFCDERESDVRERLKEILDLDVSEQHINSSLEAGPAEVPLSVSFQSERTLKDSLHPEISEQQVHSSSAASPTEKSGTLATSRGFMRYCTGIAIATAVALLATATSLFYLTD